MINRPRRPRHARRLCNFEHLEPRRLLATYYVSTGGSNQSAGSQAAPWQTLQHAADHVAAGDTVVVTAGNYVGFDLRTSGTAASRITFAAQKGAVINAVNPATKRDGINLENVSHVTVDGFTLLGTNDPATSRAGIRVVGDGFDTGVFSTGVIVRNNAAHRWGTWGIFTAFADDITIEGNVCSRSVKEHGIYFSNSADRPVIRNNTCWGNANCGIHMNADIETGNTALSKVDGIISGALVDANTCYGNGGGSAFSGVGGSAINCDGVRDSRITNNLLYDNHAGGIALYQIDAAAPATGNTIANNTVIQAADGRWCLLVTGGAVNTTVFNNVLFNLHPTRGAIELSGDSAAGFVSDYNLVEDRFSHDESFVTLAQWRTATGGGDAHSAAISQAQMGALFANYAGNDFSLAPASAAIDRGTAGVTNESLKLAPLIDRAGASRPAGGGFDVGAFERPVFASVTSGKLTINGTAGVDAIAVTLAGASYTVTRNGASATFAAAGITGIEVFAHDGDDAITLGPGIALGAYVDAGAGNDYLQGGDGADTLTSGAGKDRAFGGVGDDRLTGNGGHDKLYGEAGKDRLYGGDGNDTLDGGSSSDRFWGDAGNNTAFGQGGDDYFYARNGAADTLYGGVGTDHAQVDAGDVLATIEDLLP